MLTNYKDKYAGFKIYGFCNGYFGRDSYDDKTIIASGKDWIVAMNESDRPEFASFDSEEEMIEMVEAWTKEEEELF
ncbi:hypothetical protein P4639_22090 [Priestia megaterium]|uniref:hypothetical protein n=1 Tax=Priestia megaterium TaxID=1404 RepID=UPI002E1CC010|nr:hypothetical protein [Priestia megaterium]